MLHVFSVKKLWDSESEADNKSNTFIYTESFYFTGHYFTKFKAKSIFKYRPFGKTINAIEGYQ